MSGVDEQTGGPQSEQLASQYRRRLDSGEEVRVDARTLMKQFGYEEPTEDECHRVADELWMAGIRVRPTLANYIVRRNAPVRLESAQLHQEYKITPVGAAIATCGALAIGISAFLPLDEAGGHFLFVRKNTPIQHGAWWFLAFAAAILVATYQTYTTHKRSWSVIALGVVCGLIVFGLSHDESWHTLVAENPSFVASSEVVVAFGVALYVAGAGALLTVTGGWMMRRSDPRALEPQIGSKKCPDCAETVRAEARVCKHCGYRWSIED